MAVIRRTIGVGGDYADIGTAYAAIYAYYPYVFPAPHMTDDWELLIISDFIEGGLQLSSANQLFWEQHYIKIYNPGNFTITVNTYTGRNLRFTSRSNHIDDLLIMDGLKFNMAFYNFANATPWISFNPGSQWAYVSAQYKNLIFIGNGYHPSDADRRSALLHIDDGSLRWTNATISNCKAYNYGTFLGAGSFGALQKVTIENTTIHGCYYGMYFGNLNPTTDFNGRNIICSGSVGFDFRNNLAGVNLINCADSDGSIITSGANQTNCKSNIIPSDEFESLVSTSDDFLKLKLIDAYVRISVIPRRGPAPLKVKFNNNIEYSVAGKILPAGGIVPTLETKDLAGNLYGEFGFYPIGCYNAEANPLMDVWET